MFIVLNHQVWGEHGLAARLLEIQKLAGGYDMVIMELLAQEDGWMTCSELIDGEQAALRQLLLDLLRRAHATTDQDGR
jgi:hypothetical protein